jgi:hypothetical protein
VKNVGVKNPTKVTKAAFLAGKINHKDIHFYKAEIPLPFILIFPSKRERTGSILVILTEGY